MYEWVCVEGYTYKSIDIEHSGLKQALFSNISQSVPAM